jgi:hypothetical protein
MTDDENGNTDPHENDYLRFKVVTNSKRYFYCNKIELDEFGNNILLGAYERPGDWNIDKAPPCKITINSDIDYIVELSRAILPDFFLGNQLP